MGREMVDGSERFGLNGVLSNDCPIRKCIRWFM